MDTLRSGHPRPATETEAQALAHALRESRRALVQTVHAISAVAARRDHYTAQHQLRVALLALAIGEEMRLEAAVLEGLYLGALVHDIGKIAIPTEVLAKPARLTAEEYALVRTHVRVGWEILEAVSLPWPIQSIIGQHHERLDGTGYPAGLLGADIVLEARIVAVADVFQALCDYRPYRAALGIAPALAELEQGAGVTFDGEVVRALKRLLARERAPSAAALWQQLESSRLASTVVLPVR